MKKIVLMLMVLLVNGAFAWTLKTGTYDLAGGTSNWGGSSYTGEVVIAPQGDNYKVLWRIGNRQAQVGFGVLRDDILSVAFTDLDDNTFWGVASYRVKPFGELEGIWASSTDHNQKPEYLVWKNHYTN
jgi:hypothetical protein